MLLLQKLRNYVGKIRVWGGKCFQIKHRCYEGWGWRILVNIISKRYLIASDKLVPFKHTLRLTWNRIVLVELQGTESIRKISTRAPNNYHPSPCQRCCSLTSKIIICYLFLFCLYSLVIHCYINNTR